MTQPEQRDARGMYVHPITGDAYWSVSKVTGLLDKGWGLQRWYMKRAADAAAELAVEEARRVIHEESARSAMLDLVTEGKIKGRVIDPAIDRAFQSSGAADLGTAVHDVVEREWHEHVPDVDVEDRVKGHLNQFRKWRERWLPEPVIVEATVYSHRWHYAGTLDAIVDLPAPLGRTLLDVKTGKSVYGDTAWQLAAYGGADEYVVGPPWKAEPMPEVESYAVLHLRPRSVRFVPFTIPDSLYDRFVMLADVKAFVETDVWKQAMGSPLTAPPTEE